MNCKTLFQTLLLSLALFSGAFALGEGDSHFYDVKDLKFWASGGVDYRKFDVGAINDLIFNHMTLAGKFTLYEIKDVDAQGIVTHAEVERVFIREAIAPSFYKQFGEEMPMGFIEFGADYKRFSMGFRFAGMQTNISQKPNIQDTTINLTYANGVTGIHRITNDEETLRIIGSRGDAHDVKVARLQDVQMFNFNVDINFGFMLLPESSPFNIIPRIGLGYSFLDVVFPGTYTIYYENAPDPRAEPLQISAQNYTSFGKSITPELEVRMRLFGGLHVAANAGWRVTRYDAVILAEEENFTYFLGSHDGRADSYYGGVKLVYVFKSKREQERED